MSIQMSIRFTSYRSMVYGAILILLTLGVGIAVIEVYSLRSGKDTHTDPLNSQSILKQEVQQSQVMPQISGVLEKTEDAQNTPSLNDSSTSDNSEVRTVQPSRQQVSQTSRSVPKPRDSDFRIFLPEEFNNLFNSTSSVDVDIPRTPPSITGIAEADNRIYMIAERRGYRLRGQSIHAALHPSTAQAFNQLRAEAKKAGQNLVLVSGFRSYEQQRTIFLSQLQAEGVDTRRIASGSEDVLIDKVLQMYSAPGYSRHHTGYAIDLGCNDYNLINFKNTSCFEWMSANNYANAKKFGFIPSYPAGVNNQGPNPEEWEYVWVGIERLR